MTVESRFARLRRLRKEAGLISFRRYVKPEHVPKIDEFIGTLENDDTTESETDNSQ